MFIRKTTRRVKGREYSNYLLVESVRTPKGPRQKTVCSLGNLAPRPKGEWLKLAHRVEQALAGEQDLFEPADAEVERIVRRARGERPDTAAGDGEIVEVRTDQVQTEQHREAGPVHVGCRFWERLGLDRVLADCGLSERARRLTCAMVMNRLVSPGSEHAMPDWIRRTALGDILGTDFSELADDALCRNLDTLYPNRARIEFLLVDRERNLFNLDPYSRWLPTGSSTCHCPRHPRRRAVRRRLGRPEG